MSDEQLKQYFKFDGADLAANRMGQVTQKQIARLAKEVTSSRNFGLIGGSLLVIVAILPTLLTVAGGAVQSMRIGFILPWVCLWLPIWGGIGYVLIRGAFSKRVITLQKVEGPINIVKVESTDSEHHTSYDYELHIGGKEFNVDSDLANYMMQGDTYAIYYATDVEDILSVEPIMKAK